MQILKKQLLDVNLQALICSLYTLFENHEIFLKMNLRTGIVLDKNNGHCFCTKIEIFQELNCLLNKPSLRRFSYHLLEPILNPNSFLIFSEIENRIVGKEIFDETILLKKYLRKFNYNYRRYFLYQNSSSESSPTTKEINVYAVKILFLLVGI